MKTIRVIFSLAVVLGLILGGVRPSRADNASPPTPQAQPPADGDIPADRPGDPEGDVPTQVSGEQPLPAADNPVTDTLQVANSPAMVRASTSSELGWERVLGVPAPNRILGIDGSWAVGDEGSMWYYDGQNWQAAASPTSLRLYSVSGSWAVGDGGTVLHYEEENGGWVHWGQRIPDVSLYAVQASSYKGWAVGAAGTILAYDYASGWLPVASPTTAPLLGVSMVHDNLAFAVGSEGTILSYRGTAWQAETSPTLITLNSVSMYGDKGGWAVGDRGVILRYDGTSWKPFQSPVQTSLRSVIVLNSADAWAVGQGGVILHYNGQNWQQVASPVQYSLYDLSYNGLVWVAGFAGTILSFNWQQWQPSGRLTESALRAVVWDGDKGWAVGDDGAALYNSDTGWQPAAKFTDADLYAAQRAGPGDVWAAGEEGIVLHNTGSGWVSAGSPTVSTLRGLAFSGPNQGWAVGGDQTSGVVLSYDGAVWEVHTNLSGLPHAVAVASSSNAWAVGEAGAIWRYQDGSWAAVTSPTRATLRSVAASSLNDAWAVGDGGTILHYGGSAWQVFPSPTPNALHKVIMRSSREGWAMGDSGLILHYNGQSWRVVSGPTAYQLLGAAFDASGNLWAVGGGGSLIERLATANDFQLSFSPQPAFVTVGASATLTVTASGLDGFSGPVTVSVISMPFGLSPSWSTTVFTPPAQIQLDLQAAATLPAGPQAVTLFADSGAVTRTIAIDLTALPGEWLPGVQLQPQRRMNALAYIGSGQALAVGNGGTLLRYTGTEWHAYAAPTTHNLYAVDALSTTLAWAAGDGGTLLRFNGQTWLQASSPTTMPLYSLVLVTPNDGWAVGGGGSVLHYNGVTWQSVQTPGKDWLYDVTMLSKDIGLAVGWGGVIWRYDGTSWQHIGTPVNTWLRAVSFVGSQEAWAVGSEGTILHYTAEVGYWRSSPSPTAARLFDVRFDGPTDGWAVGGDGTVLRYDQAGWHRLPSMGDGDWRAMERITQGFNLIVGEAGNLACYRPARLGTLLLPGCGGKAVNQTNDDPQRLFLPSIGKNFSGTPNLAYAVKPAEQMGVQAVEGIYTRDPAVVQQLAAAGVGWVRVPLSWKLIEPTNTTPDQFHWSYYDDWFELLSSYGIRPLLTIARNPSWAGTLPAASIDRSNPAEQTTFIAAAAARYSRAPYNVQAWEVYNEPDNSDLSLAESGRGMWGNDAAGYVEQLKRVYPAITAATSSAKVLLGGLAHDWYTDEGGPFVRTFITDVVSAGGSNYFDVMNFHYYDADFNGQILDVTTTMQRLGLNKPVVCTSVGKTQGTAVQELSGEVHARYLPKVMVRGLANKLQLVTWATVGDAGGGWRPGLFAMDKTTRPAYKAYRTLTQVLDGAGYSRPLSGTELRGQALEGYVFIHSSGHRLDAVWTNADDTVAKWQVQAGCVKLTNKYGSQRQVCDGDDGSSDGLTSFDVGVNPLYVWYIP